MAHTPQERYSKLVLAKLRSKSIYRDLFNQRYEGRPVAGAVKIPFRGNQDDEGEVQVQTYDKVNGVNLTVGATSYITLPIDQDIVVNELVDGFDAASVPDNLIADRLDSAGYSMGITVDGVLRAECIENGTDAGDYTVLTKDNIYDYIIDQVQALKKKHVNKSEMWLTVSSDVFALLLKDTVHFIRSTAMGDEVVREGEFGRLDGIPVYEDVDMPAEIDFIIGNRVFAHFVDEWSVPVGVSDLKDGKHVGASAVQGRRVYGKKISRPTTITVKYHTNPAGF